MSFSDIFKKSFLSEYSGGDLTLRIVLITFLICGVLSFIVCGVYYIKSKKYFFSREFLLSLIALPMITSALIMTMQASIVVSLGMVGALSIVRFRTAIKNPLDLVFLFWSISIGIVCGAGVYYIAFILSIVLSIFIIISDYIPSIRKNQILSIDGVLPFDEQRIELILKKNLKWWNVKNETVQNDRINLLVEANGIKNPHELILELKEVKGICSVSIIRQEGMVD